MGGDFGQEESAPPMPETVEEALEIHNNGIVDALNELFSGEEFGETEEPGE